MPVLSDEKQGTEEKKTNLTQVLKVNTNHQDVTDGYINQ